MHKYPRILFFAILLLLSDRAQAQSTFDPDAQTALRQALDAREAALMRQVDSPRGLQTALQRDPLLNIAYQKLKALRDELNKSSPADGVG